METDKKYFEFKREKSIERLNRNIKKGIISDIEESFTSFLRIHKQWLLIK